MKLSLAQRGRGVVRSGTRFIANGEDAGRQRLVLPLELFSSGRLPVYGFAIAMGYATLLLYCYRTGLWLLTKEGVPIYHDFACFFTAGLLALHGNAAAVYNPHEFVEAQQWLVGAQPNITPAWSYPPIFLLLLAPLAALPYIPAFLVWAMATLIGYVGVAHGIVRRPPAAALALASPFAALNFLGGQSGALTACLVGGSLLALETRPILAGFLIGSLSYKPQFGILFPVALLAARQWRAFASAALTVALLIAMSAVFFGLRPWARFPDEIGARTHITLAVGPGLSGDIKLWGLVQTVFGLVRRFGGSAALASVIQGATTLLLAAIVWQVWRSPARYRLKAAALSAAALAASPYAFCYSLTAIAIPVAFIAADQIEQGLLRGEQAILLALAAAGFLVFATVGKAPVGALIVLTVLGIVLRRVCEGPAWRRSAPGALPRSG